VESIPFGNFHLESPAGVRSTSAALIGLVDSATRTIDLTAALWNLLDEEAHRLFTPAQMEGFGADEGRRLSEALEDAATRNVTIRVLLGGVETSAEIDRLVATSPSHVFTETWDPASWYGAGIMHQKFWIFDRRHILVGSANQDWKSFTQVMELGVVVTDSADIAGDLSQLFECWWAWAALDVDGASTSGSVEYFSEEYQTTLRVPRWSTALEKGAASNPFGKFMSEYNIENQGIVRLNGGLSNFFISASPAEITVPGGRSFDEDALIYTIRSATKTVDLNVMDFVTTSLFPVNDQQEGGGGVVWWHPLIDALLSVLYAK